MILYLVTVHCIISPTPFGKRLDPPFIHRKSNSWLITIRNYSSVRVIALRLSIIVYSMSYPDSKVHGANMGPTRTPSQYPYQYAVSLWNFKYKSRGFETLRDLTEIRLFGYWDGALGPVGPRWAPCWPHEACYWGRLLPLTSLEMTTATHPETKQRSLSQAILRLGERPQTAVWGIPQSWRLYITLIGLTEVEGWFVNRSSKIVRELAN